MKRQLKRAVALLLGSGMMMSASFAAMPAFHAAAADCVIDTGKTHQYITKLGQKCQQKNKRINDRIVFTLNDIIYCAAYRRQNQD